MRQHRHLIVGVLVAIGFASLAGVAVAGSEEDLAAINKTREMEAACLTNADPAGVVNVYAADVEFIPPGEPALEGAEAVQGWYEAMIGQFDGKLEYTSAEVKILGDWAFERYAATATLTPKEGGETLVEKARGIHIYRRGEDGSWKITHDVWSYAPPAE